jgi:hypothetical protein
MEIHATGLMFLQIISGGGKLRADVSRDEIPIRNPSFGMNVNCMSKLGERSGPETNKRVACGHRQLAVRKIDCLAIRIRNRGRIWRADRQAQRQKFYERTKIEI